MPALDHFERSEGLLRLIVVVELPRKIPDRKEHGREREQAPAGYR
jgi:hypothetical protein